MYTMSSNYAVLNSLFGSNTSELSIGKGLIEKLIINKENILKPYQNTSSKLQNEVNSINSIASMMAKLSNVSSKLKDIKASTISQTVISGSNSETSNKLAVKTNNSNVSATISGVVQTGDYNINVLNISNNKIYSSSYSKENIKINESTKLSDLAGYISGPMSLTYEDSKGNQYSTAALYTDKYKTLGEVFNQLKDNSNGKISSISFNEGQINIQFTDDVYNVKFKTQKDDSYYTNLVDILDLNNFKASNVSQTLVNDVNFSKQYMTDLGFELGGINLTLGSYNFNINIKENTTVYDFAKSITQNTNGDFNAVYDFKNGVLRIEDTKNTFFNKTSFMDLFKGNENPQEYFFTLNLYYTNPQYSSIESSNEKINNLINDQNLGTNKLISSNNIDLNQKIGRSGSLNFIANSQEYRLNYTADMKYSEILNNISNAINNSSTIYTYINDENQFVIEDIHYEKFKGNSSFYINGDAAQLFDDLGMKFVPTIDLNIGQASNLVTDYGISEGEIYLNSYNQPIIKIASYTTIDDLANQISTNVPGATFTINGNNGFSINYFEPTIVNYTGENELAKLLQNGSNKFASINTGILYQEDTLSLKGITSGTIMINNKEINVSESDTLEELIDRINNTSGIGATVSYSDSKLNIEGEEITFEDGTSNFFAIMNLQKIQDQGILVNINGTEKLINGNTLTLENVSPNFGTIGTLNLTFNDIGETIVSVYNEGGSSSIIKEEDDGKTQLSINIMNEFVNTYNELMTLISQETQNNASLDNRLYLKSQANALKNNVLRVSSGKYSTDFGISSNISNNTTLLSFDEEKFKLQLENNEEEVISYVSEVAKNFQSEINFILNSNYNSLKSDYNKTVSKLEKNNNKLNLLNSKLTNQIETYKKQYELLENALSQLNKQNTIFSNIIESNI